jgi:hypothetical protein
MQFSIKEWKKYYDRVQQLSRMLRDAMPDNDGNPALAPLSRETRDNLEIEIKNLTDKTNQYLDACHMKPKEPLWKYNREDPKTWASHESFAYAHLMDF